MLEHPSWTPHQKSQLLGTRSVIQQLGERGGSGGVWGKLETSGETAILRVLLVSLASFLLSFCLSLSNEEDWGSTISTKFEIWDFSAFWILNFLLTLVDWSNIYDDALWTRSVFKYWSKEPQHWVEHQCIAITIYSWWQDNNLNNLNPIKFFVLDVETFLEWINCNCSKNVTKTGMQVGLSSPFLPI